MFLTSALKRKIDKASVVSFDIFDTLLLRPYVKPTDLFEHLEQQFNVPDFAEKRKIAEQEALAEETTHDVTLDDIYQRLPMYYTFQKREIALETECLTPNPEMIDVWQYAQKKGKKIIIISDMYLSKSVLANILNVKGFKGYNSLYVSNETHKRKDNGLLYQHVLADLNISARDILHIGDNEYSDIKMAQKAGLNTCHYPKISDCFFNENPTVKAFISIDMSLEKSIFLGTLIIGWHQFKYNYPNSSYWHKIGYLFGAPIHYIYAQWLAKQVQTDNLSGLLFVARDGYTTQKIFQKLFANVPSYYVYAPRFTNMLSRLDFGETSHIQTEREQILLHFLNKEVCLNLNDKDLCNTNVRHQLLTENKNLLKKYAKEEKKAYASYISSLNLPKGILGVVDTVSLSFSAQKLISSICLNEVKGYYVNALATGKNISSFSHRGSAISFCHFIEFLMAAPERPIQRIKNKAPVYKEDINKHEQYKINIYSDICKGAISGAEYLNHQNVTISENSWYQWFNAFYNNPSEEDKKMMKNIQNGIDANHTRYEPIFPNWYIVDKKNFPQTENEKIYIFNIPFLKICKKKTNTSVKKIIYLLGFLPILKYKRRLHHG